MHDSRHREEQNLRSIFVQESLVEVVGDALGAATKALCAFGLVGDWFAFDFMSLALGTYPDINAMLPPLNSNRITTYKPSSGMAGHVYGHLHARHPRCGASALATVQIHSYHPSKYNR
jgi:cellulase/cellobiase CelA1